MKCSARSFFKTFFSVVWFIVVVNVMCLFHVVSGSEAVTPKDSDYNVNVTFSERNILDNSLNSTGGFENL